MIDVQPTNEKLEYRACSIISNLANVDESEANKLFIEVEKCKISNHNVYYRKNERRSQFGIDKNRRTYEKGN